MTDPEENDGSLRQDPGREDSHVTFTRHRKRKERGRHVPSSKILEKAQIEPELLFVPFSRTLLLTQKSHDRRGPREKERVEE